jgi:predicted RNA-binding Zn-ribbon protein involved in translation (DUF1610 family)
MSEIIKTTPLPFRCPNCGSFMVHKIKTHSLECINCKSTKAIDTTLHKPLKQNLSLAPKSSIFPAKKEVDCPGCGADIILQEYEISKKCPYCKTPLVTKPLNKIEIVAILPFFIDENEAKKIFKDWLGSLWFAPSSLSNLKNFEHNFEAIYVPYFSFDAKTESFYQGERGDAYYVRVQRRVIINGREEIVEQMERRIRWSYVQGVVRRDFFNILVSAKSKAPALIQKMLNYDLNRLVDFNPSFLSGYKSFEYDTEVKNSYTKAQAYMKEIIYNDVLWDIGGDEQRVHSINTSYSNEKFELLSLPIWLSSFKYANKEYNIVINGVNGEIIGERPYSYVKISLLVISIIAFILLLFYLENNYHFFEEELAPTIQLQW